MQYFILGLHCHQPVGNFDFIFEESYKNAYLPFLEILEKYPEIKVGYHFSAPLLQYWSKKYPDFIQRIKFLVQKKQIEIIGGGFYEPVLTMLSHSDRKAQIVNFTKYLQNIFSTEINGLWLTERVWDNSLLEDLVEAHIKYILLDDYHFFSAGFSASELEGYFLTERENKILAIFPISQDLRYLIPFSATEKIKEYFINSKTKLGVLFDDGEKFGVWPGTNKWVYTDGWLKSFFSIFSSKDVPALILPTEYYNNFKPQGRCFLPSCSYFEMGEWSLPSNMSLQFAKLIKNFKEKDIFEKNKNFLKGSIWENFLVKYEESFYLYKKMHLVSQKIKQRKCKEKKLAEDYLFKSQCNDVYWHGVFGGLYLPHLRHSAYKNLICAEKLMHKKPELLEIDLNLDNTKELYLNNNDFVLSFFPKDGATLNEFSIKKFNLNLGNTLKRRLESYHFKKELLSKEEENNQVKTIHQMQKTILPAEEKLFSNYEDRFFRRNFRNYFLNEIPPICDCQNHSFLKNEIGNFANGEYKIIEKNLTKIFFQKKYLLGEEFLGDSLSLEKEYYFYKQSINFKAKINNKFNFFYALEFNLSLPSCDSEYGEIWEENYLGSFSKEILLSKIKKIILKDKVMGGEILFYFKTVPEEIYGFPIYTISQSESGLEKIFQQYCILIFFKIKNYLELEIKCRN